MPEAHADDRRPDRALRFGDRGRRRVAWRSDPGEVVGLIGPNGAGKTTLIDAVTGFVDGQPAGRSRSTIDRIDGLNATQRARLGLRRSFQSLELFEDISVEENIRAGSDQRASRLSWLTDLFWPGHHDLPPTAVAAIHEFELEPHLDQTPEELPYGRRRLVGIARTVASGPSVVMLDEPAAGLDENESAELARLIRRLADERNMGVLLVEHDVGLVMSTCDRIVVIDFGRVIAQRHARGDPRRPGGARRLPRPRRRRSRRWRIVTGHPHRGAGPVGRLRQDGRRPRRSTSTSTPARSSPSSAPNGAGKTTTLLTLAGELHPDGRARSGSSGKPTRSPMHARCRNGLGYVTEERSVIMDMSVADNLKLAAVAPAVAFELLPGARADHGSPRRALLGRRAADALAGAGPRSAPRRCCWPTSCPSGWPRSSSPTSSRRSATRPTSAASACCSSSSTSARRSRSPIAST